MSQEQQRRNDAMGNQLDLREEMKKYLKYWPWFLLTVLICTLTAFIYLRYATPVYRSVSTIILKDTKGGNSASGMSAFSEMGLFAGMGENSIENEIGIIKSRRIVKDVVEKLDLNIRYFMEGTVQDLEVYETAPLLVNMLNLEDFGKFGGVNLNLRLLENNNLEIKNPETGKIYKGKIGAPVRMDFGHLVVNLNSLINPEPGTEEIVSISSSESMANSFRARLQVNLTDQNSSMLELGVTDPIKERAQNFLDQLVLEYNRDAIEDKNLIARNTAEFIEERLAIINEELDSVETGKEEFKEKNRLTDIEAQATMYVQNASEFNQKQQELGTQLELANAMISYMDSSTSFNLLPANLGITEGGVNQQISEYNQLILERNRILAGSTEKNPVVIKLGSQIEQLRDNINNSLGRYRSNIQISQKELQDREEILGSKISAVPAKERLFRGIERQQNIKEALYVFLLQKREENSLSLAVTAPKAKIVDRAFSSAIPISPNSRAILLGSFLFGLFVPFSVIYLKNLFNNKINKRKDIEEMTKEIPVVGEIPRVSKTDPEFIEKNDRSVLAESFRILHTNLQYLLVNAGDKASGNTIFVTSTIKGEGKTFVAFNLAVTLANAGKKVLVVGGDLRNPQLQRFESDARELLGVSDFLVNNDMKITSLIRTSTVNKNLEFLASGSIPPNPSELWRRERTATLFAELEGLYDYIIVDTAPAMLVTDTFLINKYANLTLYVVRSGYTETKLLNFAVDAKNEGKLHDVSFVLNDVELANFGYGNKYGYSYGEERQGFWKRMRNRAAF